MHAQSVRPAGTARQPWGCALPVVGLPVQLPPPLPLPLPPLLPPLLPPAFPHVLHALLSQAARLIAAVSPLCCAQLVRHVRSVQLALHCCAVDTQV